MADFHSDELKKLKEDGNNSFKKGDYVEAIAKYEEAFEAGFSEKNILYNNIGKCYMMLGKYDEAITRYDLALHEKPEYSKAIFNRAMCRFKELVGDGMGTSRVGMLFPTEKRQRLLEVYKDLKGIDAGKKGEDICNVISDYVGAKLAWITIDAKQTEDGAVKIMEMQSGVNSGYAEYDKANPGHKIDGRAKEKIKELVASPESVFWSIFQENSESSMFTPWDKDEYARLPRPTSDNNMDIGNLQEYRSCTKHSMGLELGQGDMALDSNAVFQMASADKLVFHELLESSMLDTACRPRTKKYKKPMRGHGTELCDQIWKDFDGKKIITKIPDSKGCGQGVKEFDSKAELHAYLNGGLTNLPGVHSSNSEVIVEEYLSTFVTIEGIDGGRPKDATIRATFIVGYSNGDVTLHPLDAYYRIPLSADGIVRGANSFGIMPDDKKALLFSSLEKHKAVFGYLLSTSLDDVRSHISSLSKFEFRRRSADAFSTIGQYSRARNILGNEPWEGMTSAGVEWRHVYFYAKAKIEYYACNFKAALSHLQRADKDEPLTWKLSAFCLRRKGDLENALRCLENYKVYGGNYIYRDIDLAGLKQELDTR